MTDTQQAKLPEFKTPLSIYFWQGIYLLLIGILVGITIQLFQQLPIFK